MVKSIKARFNSTSVFFTKLFTITLTEKHNEKNQYKFSLQTIRNLSLTKYNKIN